MVKPSQQVDAMEERKSEDSNDSAVANLKDIKLDMGTLAETDLMRITMQTRDVIAEFKKYTDRRKLLQAVAICVLLLVMVSFFIVTYILSQKQYVLMQSSVDDLYIIFGRTGCSQNALNALVETYIASNVDNDALSEKADNATINKALDSCRSDEYLYKQNIVTRQPIYLASAQTLIQQVESGNYCEVVYKRTDQGLFNSNLRTTYEDCMVIGEQIRKQGLTTFYFDIIKSVQQMQLEYESVRKANQTVFLQLVRSHLNGKVGPYVDLLMKIVVEPQMLIQ